MCKYAQKKLTIRNKNLTLCNLLHESYDGLEQFFILEHSPRTIRSSGIKYYNCQPT